MKENKTRAHQVGRSLGLNIVMSVNLMYQNNTAMNFLRGLIDPLVNDLNIRIKLSKERKKNNVSK